MSRILVAFASTHGQTSVIAGHLADRLRARGHLVSCADANREEPPPPDAFDVVVLGSRIQFGVHAPAIAAYVRGFADELAAMPTGFFSVSLSAGRDGAGPDPNAYLAHFFTRTRWRPTIQRAFGGALPYRRYGRLLRFVMKQLARAGGHSTDTTRDHVYTDWTAVDRFADEVARLVPVRVAMAHTLRGPAS